MITQSNRHNVLDGQQGGIEAISLLNIMSQACPIKCEVSITLTDDDEYNLCWSFNDIAGVRCGRNIVYNRAGLHNTAQVLRDIEDSRVYIRANITGGPNG